MVSDFEAEHWAQMTNAQRIERCREYAREAELIAQSAHSDHKTQYTKIAEQWLRLAAELERFGRSDRPPPTRVGGQQS